MALAAVDPPAEEDLDSPHFPRNLPLLPRKYYLNSSVQLFEFPCAQIDARDAIVMTYFLVDSNDIKPTARGEHESVNNNRDLVPAARGSVTTGWAEAEAISHSAVTNIPVMWYR